MSLPDLAAFLSPRAIAVVGASATPGKIGAMPLAYLLAHGYAGALYPVNPARNEIQGLRAYPSLRAIGQPVDLAIFAVPASQADAALDDAVAAGVKGIVMFSAGFAEVGPEGEQAQRRFAARARAAGIRLLGPNCLGFMNQPLGVYATFSPVVGGGTTPTGGVAIVSQSGAFGAYAYGLARERGVGLSAWITTGNEADIQVADCIAWLAQDHATQVIMASLEGCPDGPRLKHALAAARAAGKPVVVVKTGRTALGAQAAASHTAALAGDDAVFDALFRQYGAWRAHSIEEFFDVAHLLAVSGLPANGRVGLLTVSGGVGVLMADTATELGLDVAPLPQAAQERILARVPFAATRNPVDVTGQVTADASLLDLAARAMLGDAQHGSLLVFLAAAGLTPALQAMQKQLALELRRDHPGCLLVFSTLADAAQQHAMQALGCLSFTDPSRALKALAASNFFRVQREQQQGGAQQATTTTPTAIALRSGTCNEADALDFLKRHGLPVVPVRQASSRDEAVAQARELGFPVVMKVLSPDITHKSDVGGVVLNIADEAQAGAAYDRIQARVHAAAPQAWVDGVLLAPMVRGGVECMLGAHRDPVLGPVVLLSLGGVHVELLRDVSLRLAPVDLAQAREMVSELKSAALLDGYRGGPKADVAALAQAIVALSDLAVAAGDSLQAIDINPFVVLPQGQGAMALDAVVLGTSDADRTSTPSR